MVIFPINNHMEWSELKSLNRARTMTVDPYSVLGVLRSASDKDIQRAFRKLAKQLHPDLNPGDKPAAERFKKASQAYEILGDPEKRRRFDAGEISASGEPRHSYAGAGGYQSSPGRGPADDMGFGDIFSDLFSGRGGSRGRPRCHSP